MNYTENYHLPQWKKEDRIMMEDFNRMCADIESGLTAGKTEREQLAEKIRLAEAGTSAGAQAALHSGLFRLAYNRWHYLAALEETPRQIGFFRRGFAQGEGGQLNGMLQLPDRQWTTNGDEALTLDNMRSSIKALSAISYSAGTDTCAFTFTPPYSGRMTYFSLAGSYSDYKSTQSTGACTIRLYDDISGALLLEKPGSFNFTATSGAGSRGFSLDYILHGKHRYRIEVQLAVLDVKCSYRIDTSTSAISKCITVAGCKKDAVTTTNRFQLDEASQGGMFLVHYDTWGPGGSVSIEWQGETLAPYKIRTITDSKGRAVQEAEFRLSKAVPADSTAKLVIRCESGGEFSLYDWGGMLI